MAAVGSWRRRGRGENINEEENMVCSRASGRSDQSVDSGPEVQVQVQVWVEGEWEE